LGALACAAAAGLGALTLRRLTGRPAPTVHPAAVSEGSEQPVDSTVTAGGGALSRGSVPR